MDAGSAHVYTPTELNREARLHIEAGFSRILIEAEISNLSRPASGHLYFTLKDARAQVRCALFRSAAMKLAVQPCNGMQVLARGRLSLYEPRGEFQLIVDGLQEAGEGALQRRFEELKNKLQAEGLFDPVHKQALPTYPRTIGVVTSPGGAALRDILHVLGRRWPLATVRLYPASVQGSAAAAEICTAIRAANRHGWADVLIVGRGGGSLEDLAAFNDETVARTVFSSALPVISAVGHETDFSISDFVADLRAPTPSAAAELAVPEAAALIESFQRAGRRLARAAEDRLRRDGQALDHLAHRLRQRHPAVRLEDMAQRLSTLGSALLRATRQGLEGRTLQAEALQHRLQAQRPDRRLSQLDERVQHARALLHRLLQDAIRGRRQRLQELARTLHAVSPLDVIGRGYAVLTATDSGRVVSSIEQVGLGDRIGAQLADGRLQCTVDEVERSPPD